MNNFDKAKILIGCLIIGVVVVGMVNPGFLSAAVPFIVAGILAMIVLFTLSAVKTKNYSSLISIAIMVAFVLFVIISK